MIKSPWVLLYYRLFKDRKNFDSKADIRIEPIDNENNELLILIKNSCRQSEIIIIILNIYLYVSQLIIN